MKKKACKSCNHIVKKDKDKCPICGKNSFADKFQGQINILDANKSFIAQKIGIEVKGNYAIKIS